MRLRKRLRFIEGNRSRKVKHLRDQDVGYLAGVDGRLGVDVVTTARTSRRILQPGILGTDRGRHTSALRSSVELDRFLASADVPTYFVALLDCRLPSDVHMVARDRFAAELHRAWS